MPAPPPRWFAESSDPVRSLTDAVDFLDEVSEPGIGLLYDFYHLWDETDIVIDTERFASRIFGVQYNDWRESPRCAANRLRPGDGIMDIPALLGALNRGGFDGWYDLEIFSDDGRWGTDLPDSLWRLPHDELIGRAQSGLLRAWRSATGTGMVDRAFKRRRHRSSAMI
nr:TIM barrel protein [Rhizorhabdus sp.]